MDTNLKRMMPKILRPGYKQMIFDSVDVVTNAQPNHPKVQLAKWKTECLNIFIIDLGIGSAEFRFLASEPNRV